jgi:hypothetical protein
MGNEYSKTWMLFESGNGVAVDQTLHMAAGEKSRPIDAYLVTEYEGEFTRAARRAAEAVYHAARIAGREEPPMVVGYDLQGLSAGCPIVGESGGLAFAVALGKRLLGKDPGPAAATGEVLSSHGGGPVGPVLGIVAKLEAAGRLLPRGGWVIYPKDNEPEIPGELKASLSSAGLKLLAVSSVAEALSDLFDLPGPAGSTAREPAEETVQKAGNAPPSRRILAVSLVLSLLLLLGGLGYVAWQKKATFFPGLAPVHKAEPAAAMEKQAVPVPPPVTVSPKEPDAAARPADESGIVFRLTGRRAMESRLAALVAERLKTRLHPIDIAEKMEMTGRLAISWIEEAAKDPTKPIHSRMMVAATDLWVKTDRGILPLTLPPMVVTSEGSVQSLLHVAADRLAGAVIEGLTRTGEFPGLRVGGVPETHRGHNEGMGFE